MKEARIASIRTHLEIHAKPETGALPAIRRAFERAVRELAKPEPDAVWLSDEPCLVCWLAGGHVFRVIGKPGVWSITSRPLVDRWSIDIEVLSAGAANWTFSHRDEEFVTISVAGEEEEQKSTSPPKGDRLTDTAFARMLAGRIGSPFGPAALRHTAKRRWLGRQGPTD